MKIKIKHCQAEALKGLLIYKKPSEIVSDYILEAYPVRFPIYGLSLDDLIKALYDGYEVINPKLERFIGDVYDRKDFEYKIVAKIPHPVKEDIYVYMVEMRKYGTEEYSYHTEEY